MWAYAYSVGGTALSLYCDAVRIVAEIAAGKRGDNFTIPGMEGDLSFPAKLHAPVNLGIECTLRYTDSSGSITHVDGAAGHVYENLAILRRLFFGTTALVDLQRTSPHQGTNILPFEVLAEAGPTEPRFRHVFLCHAPKPFWRGTTFNSYSLGTGSIVVGGNAPVDDAVLTFTGDGRITLDATGDYVDISGSTGGTVTVDCGARTVKLTGSDADNLLTVSSPRWFHMFGGQANPVTVTGTVQVQWYDKWR